MTAVQLIVGLGNPGPEYDQTRHNAGALFVERLAHAQGVSLVADRKYFGLVGKFSHQGKDVRLLIPTTYMNRSGQSVAALAGFFRIAPDAILVAHDELDMPLASPSSRPAADTAGTTGCATSSPSSAIRILSIACGLASAIRGTAAWFPVTCSVAPRAASRNCSTPASTSPSACCRKCSPGTGPGRCRSCTARRPEPLF